eukprot:11584137-Karenia_brevis.AAC.1
MPSFEVSCRASATRTLICVAKWSDQYRELQQSHTFDHALALHPFAEWAGSYSVPFLADTARMN